MNAVVKLKKPVVVYRDATVNDLLSLLPIMVVGFDATGFGKFVALNKETVMATLNVLVANKDGILFVIEVDGEIVGMAAATIQTWYWNENVRYCQQIFCYVNPEHRGEGYGKKLLRIIEDRARTRECTTLIKMDFDYNVSKHRSKGFRPLEHHFIKVLEF